MTNLMTPKVKKQGGLKEATERAGLRKDLLKSQTEGAWAKADRSQAKQTGKPQLIRRA